MLNDASLMLFIVVALSTFIFIVSITIIVDSDEPIQKLVFSIAAVCSVINVFICLNIFNVCS